MYRPNHTVIVTLPAHKRRGFMALGILLIGAVLNGCVVDPDSVDAGATAADGGIGSDGQVPEPNRSDADPSKLPDGTVLDARARVDGAALDDLGVVVDGTLDAAPPVDQGSSPDQSIVSDAEVPLDPPRPECEVACEVVENPEACQATCAGLASVLEVSAFEAWTRCMGAQAELAAKAPDLVRVCLAALDCGEVPALVGQQCDALGRCGSEGRGYFDEASCRATPYEETRIWACMPQARRERVEACFFSSTCGDLQQCLDHAACDAAPACLGVIHTALAIDCPGICTGVWNGCYQAWGTCLSDCREAARMLPPDALRTVEQCALQPDNQCQGEPVIRACVNRLDCAQGESVGPLFSALRNRAQQCGVVHLSEVGQQRGWACLGEVHQARLRACLDFDVACEDIEACLDRAECGANPGCMDFMAP